MKKAFQTLMYSVGISKRYCGYGYLAQAVYLVQEDPRKLQNILKEIYFPIAKEHGTSVENVEKDIRTIRNIFMKNGGQQILEELTGCNFWKDHNPYPHELIEILADYLTDMD